MKSAISALSDQLLLTAMRARPALPATGSRDAGHVILAPSSRGNLGDEAMLTASIGEISRVSGVPVTILTHRDDDDWSDIAPGAAHVSIQGYFGAAGFLGPLVRLREVFSRARSFSILGADVMDGAYSRTRTLRRIALAEMAVRAGLPVRILGFSYSDRHHPRTHAYLGRLSDRIVMHGRDENSHARLAALSAGQVELVADTAFLLKPADPPGATAAAALDFAARARADGAPLIAFNANPLGTAMSAGAKRGNEQVSGLDTLVGRQIGAIMRARPDLRMILVPHDPREPHNDRALLQQAHDAQPEEIRARLFPAFEGIGARDVKSICAAADLTVTGRMHMGIASLGAGTPCLFLDFQGKVRGLLAHFGVEDMFFDWALYSAADAFAAFVLDHLERAPQARATIAERKPAVLALSAANFAAFADTGSAA